MCLTLMFIFAIYMMIDLACLDCFLQDIILYISFKTFSFHDKKNGESFDLVFGHGCL
jgi:hypothetical protein